MSGPWEQFQQPNGDAKPWEQFQPAPKEKPSKPFGQQLNEIIADVPHQLGLTARNTVEGLGDVANFVASPVRGAMNMVLPSSSQIKPIDAAGLADSIGIAKPVNGTERMVGDASRALVGAIVPIGAGASLAKNATGVTKAVGGALAANPAQQLASAAASGAAGGYTRETGGDPTSQLVASLAAGVATPFAMEGLKRGATAVANAGRSLRTPAAPSPVQVDITINQALGSGNSGMSLADLPANVADGIRKDVAKAMQIGGNLSDDAVRRLADYRLTGLTPTAGTLTLDPATVTRQKNLAKLGINSADPAAQQLGMVENSNNRALINGLNQAGAATADDAYAGGQKIIGALAERDARANSLIGDRYNAARAADGRAAVLDPAHFTTTADDALQKALLQGKLPQDIRSLLNKTATGEMPLTVDVAEQFKTRLGDAARDAMAAGDKSQAKALGIVRSALDNTPMLPGQEIGEEAIAAFNKARGLNRSWMNIVDKTPALQAVRDGIEPDKFVQQFILGSGGKSNVMDVAMLKNSIKGSPDAMDAVRQQITGFLKQKALNGAADEVGRFSSSGYNKALQAIGDNKLKLFFEPNQIAQLKALGRVSSYEQFQPVGSAVNNSNTAGGVGALLDRIASSPIVSKLPMGRQIIGEPLQNITLSMQAKQALNAPKALVNGQPQNVPLLPNAQRAPWAVSPAAFMVPQETEEERRQRGLLLP